MCTEVTKSLKTRLWVGIVLHAPTSWGWGTIFITVGSSTTSSFEWAGLICRVSKFYTMCFGAVTVNLKKPHSNASLCRNTCKLMVK